MAVAGRYVFLADMKFPDKYTRHRKLIIGVNIKQMGLIYLLTVTESSNEIWQLILILLLFSLQVFQFLTDLNSLSAFLNYV